MDVTPRMEADALRFMGVPQQARDGALSDLVREAFGKLAEAPAARSVWGRFPVSIVGKEVRAAGMALQSADLARLLARCRECYLLAVTLGPEVDRMILQAQRRGMAEGLALDACASVWADARTDEAEGEIRSGLQPGERLTMRFSPGYGDAPLAASAGLLRALDAARRIGLSVTRSFMLTPVKSVTAFIGVTTEENGGGERLPSPCENCPYEACRPGCPNKAR